MTLVAIDVRDMHTAMHNLLITESMDKAKEVYTLLKSLENVDLDTDYLMLADTVYNQIKDKVIFTIEEIDFRKIKNKVYNNTDVNGNEYKIQVYNKVALDIY